MNIELLNEINDLLKDDVSLQDISSELSLQKSQIQLMLRVQKIVKDEFSKELKNLERLEKENFSLLSQNQNLLKQIDTFKNDTSIIPLDASEDILEENRILKQDIENLEFDISNLEIELSKYPNWLNLFFR